MHGRVKKDVVQLSPEELEKQREKVRTARGLFGKLLESRKARVYSQQALDMTSKALQFHPEFPTLWGYRRELLESGEAQGDKKQVLQMEMKLLEKALGRSQKVYSIWFHRKWVVERLFEVCAASGGYGAKEVLDTELGLCEKLLGVDERNFHCWNHRAHVMGLMRRCIAQSSLEEAPSPAGAQGSPEPAGATEAPQDPAGAGAAAEAPAESEAQFRPPKRPPAGDPPASAPDAGVAAAVAPGAAEGPATTLADLAEMDLKLSEQLVNRNFSNYSAWHLRALLQQLPPGEEGQAKVDVQKELEWVQQGIYTEPNDQSVWLYHHWLTTLGRGQELQPRITHCCLLGAELFVFFSRPVCARSPADEAATLATVTCRGAGQARPAVAGALEPLGRASHPALRRRTRPLPAGGREWVLGWRFVPAGEGAQGFASDCVEADVDVCVETLGTHANGTPAYGTERLRFSGPVAACDSEAAPLASPPAASAILVPEPGPERAAMIQGELARAEELLEIEPDCRWALLARGRLAAAAGAASAEALEATEESVVAGYDRMAELDPFRIGFYKEARAEAVARGRVLAWLQSGSGMAAPLGLGGLSLRHMAPSTTFAAFGVRHLDVGDNRLQVLGPILLLRSLEELRAPRNQLTSDVCETFALPRLRLLDVSNNMMEVKSATVAPPPALCDVDVSGNAPVLSAGGASSGVAVLYAFLAAGDGGGAMEAARAGWSVADWCSEAGKCHCLRGSAMK